MGFLNKIKKILFGEEEYIGTVNNITYTLPLKYSSFPAYPGILKDGPFETVTEKYDRLTLYFKASDSVVREFIRTIEAAGFVWGSEVRYDKDNTYIIIERGPGWATTKIAYHIKKQSQSQAE